MGLFCWFSSTARKSAAAAAIQGYLEILKRRHIFDGDPAATATQVVTAACEQTPFLESGRFHHYVLAAGALAIVTNHPDIGYERRSLYAAASAAMIEAALLLDEHKLSLADIRLLKNCQFVLKDFSDQVNSISPQLSITTPSTPTHGNNIEIATPSERARVMDELIKRMQC